MLEHLKLTRVGPAPSMEMDLAPRLNFITGDNGLGKTFLLDIAWWALTRTWAHHPAVPHRGPLTRKDASSGKRVRVLPTIEFQHSAARGSFAFSSAFNWREQRWPYKQGRPPIPGLVIYARVDGGFSTWDPARNYWKTKAPEGEERPPAFNFAPDEVWDGLPKDAPRKVCNGLIADWAAWQREDGEAFEQLQRVLERLSPSPGEVLKPGKLTRVSLDDVRDHPSLEMPYGLEVALIHASAGMRRIIALAYLLIWTWQEHLRACDLLKLRPAREIIFLIDEIEAHLHPQWQRRIAPALLDVMKALTGKHGVPVQLVAATHSPLVLASAEPWFDPEQDAWFDLDLEGSPPGVQLRKRTYTPHGTAGHWLTSEAFDLATDRGSVEAENAIVRALELLRQPAPGLAQVKKVHRELRAVLSDVDSFWVRWCAFVESRGGKT